MFAFDNTGKPLGSAIVTALGYFCDEVLKLHGIEYYENPLVIKMNKSLLNNKVTLSNFEYSLNLFSLFITDMEMQNKLQEKRHNISFRWLTRG